MFAHREFNSPGYSSCMPHVSSPTHRARMVRPLIIGHRGASGYRPEHTAAAYRLAFAQGADAVEPDIVATRDGVLVVRHENEISGTTDVAERPEFAPRRTTKTIDGQRLTGWFTEDFTWAELQTLRSRERVPRMRPGNTRFDGIEPMLRLLDVLALIDEAERSGVGRVDAVIEVKHAQYFLEAGLDLGALLLGELAEAGWADRGERIVIESFELGVLDRLREAGAPGRFVFLTETAGAPADEVARFGAEATPWSWYRTDAGLDSLVGRVHGISVAKADLLELDSRGRATGPNDLVERAHARGLEVFTWTLRPENFYLNPAHQLRGGKPVHGDWRVEWRMIASSGVDGVFVDHPDLARELFG